MARTYDTGYPREARCSARLTDGFGLGIDWLNLRRQQQRTGRANSPVKSDPGTRVHMTAQNHGYRELGEGVDSRVGWVGSDGIARRVALFFSFGGFFFLLSSHLASSESVEVQFCLPGADQPTEHTPHYPPLSPPLNPSMGSLFPYGRRRGMAWGKSSIPERSERPDEKPLDEWGRPKCPPFATRTGDARNGS
ncbi:hypothetical protein LY76DRAFT_417045 [Colletotrichum caudatum]|nr:hypothetical protein LY76DRAFT_417045 [Colletotrichum caudatum]